MKLKKFILMSFILVAMGGQADAGSIIIDGTDANEHVANSEGANHEGWLYMQKVLEVLAASAPSDAVRVVVDLTTGPGRAREAIVSAFSRSPLPPNWTLKHMDSKEMLDEWLANLSIDNTTILCIPTYSLTQGDLTTEEMLIINKHAARIASYFRGTDTLGKGGALFAMGEIGEGAWDWLRVLYPGIIIRDFGAEGISSRLRKTELGEAVFSDLPDADLAAAIPWHNSFEGELAGLQVLATALNPSDDVNATRRNVILGMELTVVPPTRADLSITSSISPGPFPLGSTITYTISVTNNGPDAAQAVLLTQNFPAGTTLVSCLPVDVCGGLDNPQTVLLGTLAAGVTRTLTFVARINCSLPVNTELINTASVISSTPDLNSVNNVARVVTRVAASSSLKLDKSSLVFNIVNPGIRTKKKLPIENTGACDLVVRFDSIKRIGSDVESGKIVNPNSGDCGLNEGRANPGDCKFFSAPFNVGSKEGSTIILRPGDRKKFSVFFRPVIPAFIEANTGLPSDLVLPDEFSAALAFSVNGTPQPAINLTGRVTPNVNLINPTVTLKRSGDEFIVEFAVYDSNPGDLKGVSYEFLDKGGKVIKTFPDDDQELSRAIQEALGKGEMIRGQSFKVRQRFSNAGSHPEYASVRITVSGNTSSATASSVATSGAQSLEQKQGGIVILPNLRLSPSRQKRRLQGKLR